MSEDINFIRMIAANPDDDAPRLIYADYLDETGDPLKMARAEFIRVQIEKYRAPMVPKIRRDLWDRETKLFEKALRWRNQLPGTKQNRRDGDIKYGPFERGFIEYVAMDVTICGDSLESIFEQTPIRKLFLTDVTVEQLGKIAAMSCNEHLQWIGFQLGEVDVENRIRDNMTSWNEEMRYTQAFQSLVSRCTYNSFDFNEIARCLYVKSPDFQAISAFFKRVRRLRYQEQTVI
jgi:uncharacterized protein (TIGR02996 family)